MNSPVALQKTTVLRNRPETEDNHCDVLICRNMRVFWEPLTGLCFGFLFIGSFEDSYGCHWTHRVVYLQKEQQ